VSSCLSVTLGAISTSARYVVILSIGLDRNIALAAHGRVDRSAVLLVITKIIYTPLYQGK
jgi:hypothetical protein